MQDALSPGDIELVNREVVLEYLEDLRGLLDHGSLAERRTFIPSFSQSVKRITPR